MFPGIYFILGLILFLFLVFVIIPQFYPRKIESVFFHPDSTTIYVLSNARSTTPTKRGLVENHRLFLNKVDFESGEILFKTKLKSFSAKMLFGYSKILGITDAFTYILISGNRLGMVDNKTGKIHASRHDLIKKFPELKDFKADSVQFDPRLETIVIFSASGQGFQLETKEMTLKKMTGNTGQKSGDPQYEELNTFPYARLSIPDSHPVTLYSRYNLDSDEKSIYYHLNPGTKRYFVLYGLPTHDIAIRPEMRDFLHPQIIGSALQNNKLCWEGHFLVLDFNTDTKHAGAMRISCVNAHSEIKWTCPLIELLPDAEADRDSVIFFEHVQGTTYLFNYRRNTQSNKLLCCKIEKQSGLVAASYKTITL